MPEWLRWTLAVLWLVMSNGGAAVLLVLVIMAVWRWQDRRA